MIKSFFRSANGIAGSIGVLLIAAVSIFAPSIWGKKAHTINVVNGDKGPSGAHWLGTDRLGHDIFYQLLVSTRLTMEMALGATGIAILVGIPLGAGAALLPERVRMIALRALDTLIAFPGLLIAIVFAAVLDPGKFSAVLGVGIGLSFSFARVASSLTLAIRDREFISAARVVGVGRTRLMVRHVLPNIADSLAIATTVSIAAAIVTMAGLSFLGLGVQLPSVDWGRMLTTGVQSFYLTPFAALGPGIAIALAALVFGFFGEGLARAANPVLWPGSGGDDDSATATADGPPTVDDPYEPVEDGVLDVRDLTVSFPSGRKRRQQVVRGVSLDLAPGETLGIVGESGSGKSLTALAIAQLVAHPGVVEGRITVNGTELQRVPLKEVDRTLGTSLAVVFQDPMSSLNPAVKIRNQLIEGVRRHRGLSRAEAVLAARRRLGEVNLPTPERQLERYPHELSGGQRQRVLIAMGLMNEPNVLIADEPTTALDVTVQAQIMDLLAGINAEHNTAVVLISHNLGLISQNCDRVLVMYAGRVVEEVAADRLTEAEHPYTRALLGAVPDMAHSREQPLVSIPGQMPDARSTPVGCAYHPRCPLAVPRCAEQRPPLQLNAVGHRVACWVANSDEAPAGAATVGTATSGDGA
jgi:oligopeptide/dipeptide ABC transporter ATP-binding protein